MFAKFWLELRSSLWFIPALLVIAGAGSAILLVELDVHLELMHGKQRWAFLHQSAEGARGMLVAIASSMITVAGVAFSITIVTLSLASTQYTPRILRNFMRDRANKFVLGIFVGIFTYCLLVLPTIATGGNGRPAFVPVLAVAFAMLLALLSIACLIFFIHHTATSIQASAILEAIAKETLSAVAVLFPEELGDEHPDAPEAAARVRQWHPVRAGSFGYLQSVNSSALTGFAVEHQLVVRLEPVMGDFLLEETVLLSTDQPLNEHQAGTIRSYFAIGDFRTVEQDTAFGIRQIVDIALKALSPGINDTSTAVSCLEYISVILARLARRRIESPYRQQEGELRVIAPATDFASYVALSFDEIRLFAGGNISVLLQLLRAIRRVASATRSATRRSILLSHVRLITEAAERTVPVDYDRERINGELSATREVLECSPENLPLLRLSAPPS